MLIIDVNKISKNFGYGQLFKDVSFSLNEGEILAIVGKNGCGKSTILKIIKGLETSDTGTVNIKKDSKVAYLDQLSSNINDKREVYEILNSVFIEINDIEEKLKEYENKLNKEYNEKIFLKYTNLLEKFNLMGGYEVSAKINKVISGLEINSNILKKSYNTLSGGEKTLVLLAKTLLMEPDLLLLDEPTNHLDLKRIEWLESYIKQFKGATIIISHDRYFLDKVVHKILAIDENSISKVYTNNYSGYLKEKELEFKKQMLQYKNEQEEIKDLETKAKYFMNLGMTRNSSTLTKQAKVLFERARKIKENAINKPIIDKKIDVSFQEENKSSKKIITINNLSVLTKEKKKILDNINLNIYKGERIAFLGENGTGKSTLVKTIMGNQSLLVDGNITVGSNVKIGYIPQIIEFENEKQTLLEYFYKNVNFNEEKCRSILANFKFNKEDVNKKLKNLSGGERMKVKLAELLQKEVNTLIFDEPTNHIDIPTKEVLESALEEYSKTLIFISHDRYFINKFADKIIYFENNGIKEYLGNYDDYKNFVKGVKNENN